MSYQNETRTKYINSNHINSPNILNEYGTLANFLKIVLVQGFNEKNVLSIEFAENILKLTLPINHGYRKDQVISISGATQEVLNKEYRVLKHTTETIEIIAPDNLSEDFSTLTEIVIKVAPLGYSIVFEDLAEGVVCFKNKSLKSPGILKVIDKLPPNGYKDTWAKYARIVIGQDIDSMGNFIDDVKAPYHPSYPNSEMTGDGVEGEAGVHGFAKWEYSTYPANYDMAEYRAANGVFPTDWRIIGDDKTFYLMIRSMGRGRYNYGLIGFGNYVSFNELETYNICLQAKDGFMRANENNSYAPARSRAFFGSLNTAYAGFILKNIHGDSRVNYNRYTNISNYFGNSNKNRPWHSTEVQSINPVTGRWLTGLLYIKDADNFLRGYHRGVQILYGTERSPEESIDNQGNITLYVQDPVHAASYTNIPMLFSLKNWENIL